MYIKLGHFWPNFFIWTVWETGVWDFFSRLCPRMTTKIINGINLIKFWMMMLQIALNTPLMHFDKSLPRLKTPYLNKFCLITLCRKKCGNFRNSLLYCASNVMETFTTTLGLLTHWLTQHNAHPHNARVSHMKLVPGFWTGFCSFSDPLLSYALKT